MEGKGGCSPSALGSGVGDFSPPIPSGLNRWEAAADPVAEGDPRGAAPDSEPDGDRVGTLNNGAGDETNMLP